MGRVVAVALAVWVGVYAIVAYSLLPLGGASPVLARSFQAHEVAVYLHVFGASLAPVLGMAQFSTRLRARWPAVHRWTGRFYLGVCVLVGGAAGAWLAVFAQGGAAAQAGFLCLALAWLATGAVGLARACDGDIAGHQEWMWRNYALTWGAVMLRVYMGVAQAIPGVTFDRAYPVVAWLAWVPNAMVVEWYLARRRRGAREGSLSATGPGVGHCT